MSILKLLPARAVVLAAGLLLAAAPLQASIDILVLVNPPEKNGGEFKAFIGDAAKYKLGKIGLAAQVVSATSAEAKAPLQRARASGASFALVCRYLVDGQQMTVTLGWFDVRTGNSDATVQATGDMDLHLDGMILMALDQILGKVQGEVTTLTAGRAEPKADPAPVLAAASTPVLTVPTTTTQIVAPQKPGSSIGHHLMFSSGFAPFLPTGTAGYYFTLGYLPSLLASFFFDMPGGHFGVGLYAGMDYFTAAGVQDSATNYLLPLGLDVRYEVGNAALRPFFHVVGGPAILVMVTGSQGTVTDVLPFLKSGIGLEVQVLPWMGINALVDYDVYFEMPYLLMGFSPSLNMEFRP